MRICVIGAGAIGGLLAAKLADAGEDVSVIARGPHLAAISANGLKLIEGDKETIARVKASSRIADVGEQDLIILGMKAHQVAAVVRDLPAIYGPRTSVLTAQNGIPWWYFFKHGGPYEGARLESVDPGGVIADNLPIERVVASVVYPAAEIERPGVIRHIEGYRFSLAEIDGAQTERIGKIAAAFTHAGFKAPIVSDIRTELWTKLWGNATFNPISALTHATLEDICRFKLTRALAERRWARCRPSARRSAFASVFRLEKRIAGSRGRRPAQDIDAAGCRSRPGLEADALIGSVIELGRIVNVATPHLDFALCGRRSFLEKR